MGAEVAERKAPFLGFEAVTTQVAELLVPLYVNWSPRTEQLAELLRKTRWCDPEPPVVVSVSGTPAIPVDDTEIWSGAWGLRCGGSIVSTAVALSSNVTLGSAPPAQ